MCSSDERSVSVPVQMAIGAVEVYSLCFTGTFIILVDTLNLSHRFSHRVSKMDCRTVRDRISAWEDQELSPGEASQMADHLAHCSECLAFSQRIQEQSRWLADLPPQALPELDDPDFWKPMDDRLAQELDRLEQGSLSVEEENASLWRQRRFSVPLPAVLAYAAALALAVWWGLEQTDEPVVVQANSGTSVEATDDTPLQSSEGVDSPSEILSTPTTQEPLESEPFILQPERRVTVPPELIRPASYQPHRGNF